MVGERLGRALSSVPYDCMEAMIELAVSAFAIQCDDVALEILGRFLGRLSLFEGLGDSVSTSIRLPVEPFRPGAKTCLNGLKLDSLNGISQREAVTTLS